MEKRPVILVVMDGIGIREDKKNNAVALANKPTLDKLWAECPHTQLRAHGLAVGLPTDTECDSRCIRTLLQDWICGNSSRRK